MSTALQISGSVPFRRETRRLAAQQMVREPQQIVSAGTALVGTVLAGAVLGKLDCFYELGFTTSIDWSRAGLVPQEKETAQQHNSSILTFISGFVNPFIAVAKADKKLIVDHLDYDNRTIAFVKPVTANILFDNNIYTCQNEELGIISVSPNLDDCTEDFKDELLFVYNEYGKEEDSKLTEGAKELKRKVLAHIGK